MTYAPHRSTASRDTTADEQRARRALLRRTRLWIGGGIVAALLLIAFGVWAVTAAPAPGLSAETPGVPAGGPFELAATGLRCGVSQVGPDELEQRAAGEFCLVDVRIRNIGDRPELFDSGAQRAFGADGVAYAVAEQAVVFLNDGSRTLLEEIPPGATVAGVLPFDVPAGTKLVAVHLQGSVSMPGVRLVLPPTR